MNDHCVDRRRAAVPRLLAVLFGLLGLTLTQPAPAVARTVSPAAAEGAASSSGSTGRGTALPMRGRIAALCGTRAARRGAGGHADDQTDGQTRDGGGMAVTGRAVTGRAVTSRTGAGSATTGARPSVAAASGANAASALERVSAVRSVSAVAEPPAAVVPHMPAVHDARAAIALSSGPCGLVTALGPPPHLSAVHGRAPPPRARAAGPAAA